MNIEANAAKIGASSVKRVDKTAKNSAKNGVTIGGNIGLVKTSRWLSDFICQGRKISMHTKKGLIASVIYGLAVFMFSSICANASDSSDLARENFQKADANGDETLNKAEFAEFIDLNAEDDLGRASLVKRLNRYDTAFSNADSNGDGMVSQTEVREMGER